jgi:hypothetical protein
MKERPTSKNIDFPLPLPPPWGILLAFFPELVRVNCQIGRHSGITKSLCDATMAAKFFLVSTHCGRRANNKKSIHLLCVGWRNFFPSCAVVPVFGSGGK